MFGFFRSRLLRRILPMLTIYTAFSSLAAFSWQRTTPDAYFFRIGYSPVSALFGQYLLGLFTDTTK